MNHVAILAIIALIGSAIYFAENGAFASTTSDSGSDDSTSDDGGDVTDTPSTPALTDPWTRFDDLFHQGEANYGVDWTWLKAFCLNESNLGRAASVARGLATPSDIDGSKSSDGKSWGLLQVTLATAKGIDPQATQEKLNDPSYSVNIGAKYIAQLKKMFSPSDPNYVQWVVKSYNQGPGNTKDEIDGDGGGYADAYWTRWQSNLTKVEEQIT